LITGTVPVLGSSDKKSKRCHNLLNKKLAPSSLFFVKRTRHSTHW
jgi:hypothetical protein